jgi:hypothetical protein
MMMMRVVVLIAALFMAAATAADGPDPQIVSARYEVDVDTYPHRIMGDIREKVVLVAVDDAGREYRVDLRDTGTNVFEDIAPRVVDADGDGAADVVVVETAIDQGAQIAAYGLRFGELVKTVATPHIGTRFRWLAPVAVGDLDDNGVTDIAYVDRPHLAKTLRVWSYAAGGLTEIAAMPDLTNHRIGDEVIWGGLRDCGSESEMVLADGAFDHIVLVRLADGELSRTDTDLPATAKGFERALGCAE